MNYEQAVKLLESELYFGPGIQPGLERIAALCKLLGHPERKFKSILVAGTNGKGAVVAALSSLLAKAGHTTGAYFSPHLVDYTERFRIQDADVPRQAFAAALQQVADCVPSCPAPPTPFEALTAAAFLLFAEAGCDWAVLEVGMGGRWDATNLVQPVLSIITHVALDHTEYLGDSIGDIALEKAGIMRESAPVVLGPSAPEATVALVERALSLGAITSRFGDDFTAASVTFDASGTQFIYKEKNKLELSLSTPLMGKIQAQDASLAIRAAKLLLPGIEDASLVEGLAATRLAGRFDLRGAPPVWVLDVGHNPDAVHAFCETFKAVFPGRKAAFVYGGMRDKDWRGILALLHPLASALFTCSPNLERAAPAGVLADFATSLGFVEVTACPSVVAAAQAARQKSGEGELVVVIGSHYVVGEALPLVSE